jgi:two-component system, cell cycle sensor histidine kinase PleC
MARFYASSDSINAPNGASLASAIASPGYAQQLAAEPWVRRLVPTLVLLFLTIIWAGVIIQSRADRLDALAKAMVEMDNISALTAIDLQIEMERLTPQPRTLNDKLRIALPNYALDSGRQALIANPQGRIEAAFNASAMNRKLDDILGLGQVLTALADKAGVMRIQLADGTDALATVRNIGDRRGQLAFIQPVTTALTAWRNRLVTLLILAGASSLVIVALAVAFYIQSARAKEADNICGGMDMRIDLVLSSGRAGLWDWDVARGRLYWSDSLYDLLGLKRGSPFLSVHDVTAITHPDDGNLFEIANELAKTSEHKVDREFRLKHADGHWVWFRARGAMLRNRSGLEHHIVGIAIDVTEQKQLATEQATADMRLRDAIEAISDAFILQDASGRLVVSNSKHTALSKVSGLSFTEPSTVESAPAAYEIALPDGRWFHVDERKTNDGGRVTVCSDITPHKVYEKTLADSNATLETTVQYLEASRSALEQQARQLADLADRYLLQKAAAESANRAKATFLSNMSHELRTPLNHIIGFSEMMETSMFGPLGHERYVEYANDIGKSGRYLLEVVNDILDMSSIEAGRLQLERGHVSLSAIIDTVSGEMTGQAAARGLEVVIRKEGPLMMIGDEHAITQVIRNLYSNAIKFTSVNGHVGVRAKRVGDFIQVFIEDNGAGISAEELDRIVKPFEQSGELMDDGFKGSGLGLSISKSLTELHGGTLKIRSKMGVGTVIMLNLPVGGERAAAIQAAA